MHLTALLTCHNRREHTLACLEKLKAQELPDGLYLSVVLMDDGSNDGTGEAVRAAHPDVEILRGSGSLYWCGGMREAWKHAAKADPDYYLLLNDDTQLVADAVQELLEICGPPEFLRIAVAAVSDPQTGKLNYGGTRGPYGNIPVTGKIEPCDTFNANCVLIPRGVYQKMGILHHAYTHAMGDTDYGIQARRQGIEIFQSARFLATCPSNPIAGTWRDRSLSRSKRFNALQSPKGLPFAEWLEFNRRNSGWKWPYYAISPFLRILLGK